MGFETFIFSILLGSFYTAAGQTPCTHTRETINLFWMMQVTRINKIILTVIFFVNTVSAQESKLVSNLKSPAAVQEAPQENFQEQLINDLKDRYKLSFFDNPMLSIYASSCDEQSSSSTRRSLEQICDVVVNSEECKNVKPKEDLLNCSRPSESKAFDTVDFIVGCGQGLWNTAVEFFNFIWTIIKNAVDIPEEFMEYAESAKLYLVNEYDKAYEEAESFKSTECC